MADMAEASPPADAMETPWDEIEANYFASLREAHEEEDRKAEEDYRTKTDGLKAELFENHNSRTAIMHQLQALKEQLNVLNVQYTKKQGELKGLKEEFDSEQAARNEERERIREERVIFFNTFRRGGLAYRPVENGVSKTLVAESTEATEPEATANQENGEVGTPSITHDKDRAEAPAVVQDQPEAPAQVNGSVNGSSGNKALPNGHDHQQEHGQGSTPMEVETEGAGLKVAKAVLETEPSNEDTESDVQMDGVEVTGGPEQPAGIATQTAAQEHEPGAAMADQQASIEKPSDGHRTNGVEPTNESSSQETITEKAVDEVGAEKAAEEPIIDEPITEAPSHEGHVNGAPISAEPEEPTTESVILEESVPQETVDGQQLGEHMPLPQIKAPAKTEAVNSIPAQEDTEMPDVPVATEDVNGTEAANGIEPTTPTAPASPTLSSDLSSRHTTPALDSPVSLPGYNSPRGSSDKDLSGVIEVLDASGDLLGQMRPIDTDNRLAKRIMERPIKQSVQIRPSREFTAEDVENLPPPAGTDSRGSKWLSFYIQATGELQEQSCQDCIRNFGPFEGCVMVDDKDFPSCGNCEWNGHGCHDADLPWSKSRNDQSTKKYAALTIRPASSSSGFTHLNGASASVEDEEEDENAEARNIASGEPQHNLLPARKPGTSSQPGRKSLPSGGIPRKSGPTIRKSLPTGGTPRKSVMGRQPQPISTPVATTIDDSQDLPEINKDVLCLRDDGVVFTDPPMFRGVPLAKITTDHPYWDDDWASIEDIVTPQLKKHQDKYEQLEASGAKQRDKHLANRDAKRGRLVLRFLEEGDLHPYQLVGKEWITTKLTNYDTLYRMAHLLLEELPKMNLDVTPSQWLRHRIYEVSLERGDKFNAGAWLEKAYHDPKINHIRAKNGFQRVGRPPMDHSAKGSATKSPSKKSAPRPLKRKDLHSTPQSTPKAAANGSSKPPARVAPVIDSSSSDDEADVHPSTKTPTAPKSKIIKLKVPPRSASADDQPQPPPSKKLRISTHKTNTSTSTPQHQTTKPDVVSEEEEKDEGYTSTDSISRDDLTSIDFRVQQVKTESIASNPGVTQYWHWLGKKEGYYFEHQVLREVDPVQWSIFKEPYDFHLRMAEVGQVRYTRGHGHGKGKKGGVGSDLRVVILEKGELKEKGKGRGDVMALFRRGRTMRRFLAFLRGMGVRIVEVPG